ncbi:MAG: iron-sulfur cluster assembly accessory protein [Cyclobacteriaceae bacterium]
MQPVVITKEAEKEIHDILTNKNIPDNYGLRVGVKGGRGCAGVNYMLGFDTEKEDDMTYMQSGIKILVKKKEMMFLMGLEVDFYEGADERGFLFQNTALPK